MIADLRLPTLRSYVRWDGIACLPKRDVGHGFDRGRYAHCLCCLSVPCPLLGGLIPARAVKACTHGDLVI